jgi:hypothetical protein
VPSGGRVELTGLPGCTTCCAPAGGDAFEAGTAAGAWVACAVAAAGDAALEFTPAAPGDYVWVRYGAAAAPSGVYDNATGLPALPFVMPVAAGPAAGRAAPGPAAAAARPGGRTRRCCL